MSELMIPEMHADGFVVACGDPDFIALFSRRLAMRGIACQASRSGESCRALVAQQEHALVLVGPRLPDVAPVNLVAALAKDRGEREVTIVLFSEGAPSGSLASRAASAGASGVISLQDEDALERLLEGLEQPHRMESPPSSEDASASRVVPMSGAAKAKSDAAGRLLTVISARGGSGKTTISLLSSIAFSLAGIRTALVDFDLRFGELDLLMGLHDIPRLDALVVEGADEALLTRMAVSGTPIDAEVVLYPAPYLPERGDVVVPHTLPLIDALRGLHAVTVADTGDDWNAEHAQLLKASDCVLLVMDQRGSSMDNAQRALDLCMRLGVPLAHIHGVLDRCGRKGGIDPVSASVALRGLPVHTVDDGGAEVDELIGLGCPRELFILRNPCAVSIGKLVEQVAPLMRVTGSKPPARVAGAEGRKGRARRIWGGLAS